jgi:CRP-like cAMP-binding protein
MTTLRLLTKGDYLSEVSDVHGISISSTSRIISDVCNAVCMNMNKANKQGLVSII